MSRRLWSLEGNSQRLDGGAMFGNAPRVVWERWAKPDDAHRIPLACRSMLLEDAGRLVLFEAGVGAFFAPEMRDRYGVIESRHVLLDELARLGFSHEDVEVVVLSHLHFDHAGGLLGAYREGAELELLFPRARFVVSTEALARAEKPHPRDRASYIPELPKLLHESGRLVVTDGSPLAWLPRVRFHLSHGHTPGMLLSELEADEGPIVYGADLIPGVPWVHLPITMGYDRFPERVIDEKTVLLEDLVSRGGSLFFTHDPDVALARVVGPTKGRYGVADAVASVQGRELSAA